MAEWGKKTVNDDGHQLLWLMRENLSQLFYFRTTSIYLKKPSKFHGVRSVTSTVQKVMSFSTASWESLWIKSLVFSTYSSLKANLKVSRFQSHQQQKVEVLRVLRNGNSPKGLLFLLLKKSFDHRPCLKWKIQKKLQN